MSKYDTNLASEFYVLSCLHRLGVTANLTLGNKKGVDVVVVRESGDAITVEVKGLAGKYEWPVNNLVSQTPRIPERHFVALVSFEGRIDDRTMPPPRVWIIPFPDLAQFTREYPTSKRVNVSRAEVLSSGMPYENAWHLVLGGGHAEAPGV